MTENLCENLRLAAQMAAEKRDAPEALRLFEKFIIESVLRQCKWNQSIACRILDMHRNTLARKMDENFIVIPVESRRYQRVTRRAEESRAA